MHYPRASYSAEEYQAALDAKQQELDAMTRQRNEWANTAFALWNALAKKSEQVNTLQADLDATLGEAINWARAYAGYISFTHEEAEAYLAKYKVQDRH